MAEGQAAAVGAHRSCEACGAKTWVIQDARYALIAVEEDWNELRLDPKQGLMVTPMICQNCGNVRLLHLKR
jgi:hypothetical protein